MKFATIFYKFKQKQLTGNKKSVIIDKQLEITNSEVNIMKADIHPNYHEVTVTCLRRYVQNRHDERLRNDESGYLQQLPSLLHW